MKRPISLAAIAATIGLLGLVPAAPAEVRVGPNHQLGSDTSPFRGQDQVGLASNPSNPQHVVAVYANYLDGTCAASASFDGGETWSAEFSLPKPSPPGIGTFQKECNNSFGTGQSVEFGSGQTVYTVGGAEPGGIDFADASTLVYKSTDGGVTWQPGVVALEGGPGATTFPPPGPAHYRPSLSVHAGGGTDGADRIYVVARDLRSTGQPCGSCSPVVSAVSSNGATSFGAPVKVTPGTTNAADFPSKPVVNADGSVTVVWRTTGTVGMLQSSRSSNAGQTWSPPVDVAEVVNTGTSVRTHVQSSPKTGQSSSASYPVLAGDPTTGNLYLVYSQGSDGPNAPTPGGYQGADHFISPDSAVYFQRSQDRGDTWSAPKQINDSTTYPGSELIQTRHPSVSVSPSGRVNVVWLDRRHWFQGPGERTCSHSHIYCEDIRLGDAYYSYSINGGSTFSDNIRVSDRSLNSAVGYDTRPSGYWWFSPQSVAIGGDNVLVGWMDSREGNFDTDTQDIYVAKIDFNATGPDPSTAIDRPNAIARSVALSQVGYQGGNEGALIGGPRDPFAVATIPVAANRPTGPASRNASKVAIVNATDVAGAMAATVLARARPSPVLLSPVGGLPASVKAEVARLAPGGAYVIGSTAKLSEQVVADLVAAGVPAGEITRLQGANDAATAANIAAEIHTRSAEEAADPAFDAAVIANPASPDAAAAVGLAAARRLPILYVNATGPVPAETQSAIASLGIGQTLIIGNTSVIGASVAAALPSHKRLGGADQYGTSEAVVDEAILRGMPSNVVYTADGAQPMDATLLGGVVARATGMLVLAPAPLYANAVGQANSFGLTGVDRHVLLGPPPPPPPPPVAPPPPPVVPPPPVAPPPPAPAPQAEVFPAKLRVERVRVRGRTLSVLIRLTGRADGQLEFEYFGAGKKIRFKRTIRNGTVSTRKLLSVKQGRLGTGIVTVSYEGNKRVRRDEVRVRAARNPALLKRKTARILKGRLQVSGTLSKRVRGGVVRIRMGYQAPDGTVKFLNYRAPIKRGIKSATWRINQKLPSDAAKSGGQLSIQYTGAQLGRIGGQATAKQVRP